MKKALILLFFFGFILQAKTQHQNGYYPGREISFPNVPGFLTLKTDLHMHTILSDGTVLPNIRVEEALRDGLDAMAVTEHIEYQPFKNDIPHPDRNRSYEVATNTAINTDLIVINGAEITRDMPPGHSNAIFLEDVNKLNVTDSIKAFKEAKKQGAFIFWNHPHWEAQRPDGIATLTDLHKKLIRKGLIHGIEVVNDVTYSVEALQIALDNDLTILGTSDIHGLVDWQYDIPSGGHRPVTLVFAREKTKESLKEALFAGRTVVFFKDLLIGKSEYLIPLIDNCISTGSAKYIETWTGKSFVAKVIIENKSDAPFILKNKSKYGLHNYADYLTLQPNSSTEVQVKTITNIDAFELVFEVLNAVSAPGEHPEIKIKYIVDNE